MGTNSNTTGTNQGSGQHDASTTIGVGGATSGQAGATPAHETQAETGGSGGEQLTHSHGEIEGRRPAAPQPAAHCHPSELLARSASTSVSQNQRAPSCHGRSRCFTRKLATTMRTRLCIQPVCQSWRMPASTNG